MNDNQNPKNDLNLGDQAEDQNITPSQDEAVTVVSDETGSSSAPEEPQATQEDAKPQEETQEQATEEKQTEQEEIKAEAGAIEEIDAPSEEDVEEAKKVLEKTSADDPAKWYIVHTYSGHENKVAKSIHQRVQSLGFEDRIFDIIVPTRNTIKVSQGKKESVKEKIFPGYVLVKMILTDESWLLIRTTQGVTAFIGAGNKPTPISEKEVEAIQKFMDMEEPLYKASFTVGEAVKIVDGPFADFLGTIDNIDEAKGKLKVLVSIFGRETPVELDFLQVNKL